MHTTRIVISYYGTLPPPQNSRPIPELLTKTERAERKAKFIKIGAAIRVLKPYYDDRDYHTGKESKFEFKLYDKHNRDLQEREGKGTEIPCGPVFKSAQWERTTKG